MSEFRPGERVAVWAANTPEWQLIFYGCALEGIVMVTVNPAYKAGELEYVLGKSEADGLFTMDAYRGYDSFAAIDSIRDRLPALRRVIRIVDFETFFKTALGRVSEPTIKSDDPCVVMFTSGTTGRQKGAIFNHRGIVNIALFTQERGGLAIGEVFVNLMPMFHIGALGHAGVGTVMRDATHVLAPEWDPLLYISLVQRERGTFSVLVSTMIDAVLTHPQRAKFDLGTLRILTSGAFVV